MTMSNSPLVSYTKISPNKTSPRKYEIDTVTIHMVVGQASVETLGDIFAPTSRQASSNYGIGYDGRIGMYVEEKDRSWCTSSKENDHRAITIEVASDTTHPYAVNDAAYNALIDLLVDICQRNNIKKLLWQNDKNLIGQVDKQNMTIHKWFSNTSCPGQFLHEHHYDIAAKVNARLENKEVETMYKVQVGKAFANRYEAEALGAKVKNAGFECFIVTETCEGVSTPTSPAKIEVGSKVKVKPGSKSYTGVNIAPFVFNGVYVVDALEGDRAVLDKKGICTPFRVDDLILVQ